MAPDLAAPDDGRYGGAITLLDKHFAACGSCPAGSTNAILDFLKKRADHLLTCKRCTEGGDLCNIFLRIAGPADVRVFERLCPDGRGLYARCVALIKARWQNEPIKPGRPHPF